MIWKARMIAVVLLLLLSVCEAKRVKRIVGGHHSKAPPPDDPVVFTRIFNRDARIEGYRNPVTKVYTFLGIHYAEPPTGYNRYARPVYKRLMGDVNATIFGSPCIQPDPRNSNRIIGDEDCLILNIYTPRMPDETTGLPVIVWLHPGGFRYGSANQYGGTPLAQQGVIVVAPQYRLGSLGIIGDGTTQFDGNLALFDMATALRWVNDYISHFGGDPNQIKVMGHGSGAASAMYLSMSKSARSATDIKGVAAMSGTVLSQYATDKEPVQSVQEVAEINGCPFANEIEIVKCLRKKDAKQIIENDFKIQTERLAGRAMIKGLSGSIGFQPHIENEEERRALPSLIVAEPDEQLKSRNFTAVPLLTGVTKHETANAFTVQNINEVFGSAEKFLGSLVDTLKDLNKFLRVDEITGEITKAKLPGLPPSLTPTLSDFLKVPDTLSLSQVFSKIVESTTDVLFNLPAVLTVQLWSQVAPAFMYSFEYNGTNSRGINFLRGLPIVSDTQNSNSTMAAHGDELGYLFDCNDVFGNPVPEAQLKTEEDFKARNNLIDVFANFAKIGIKNKKNSHFTDDYFKSATDKGAPIIKVGTGLTVDMDFRFCELSLLGAVLSPVTSTSCKGLENVLATLRGSLDGVSSALGAPVDGVLMAGIGSIGNSNLFNRSSVINNNSLIRNRNTGGLNILG